MVEETRVVICSQHLPSLERMVIKQQDTDAMLKSIHDIQHRYDKVRKLNKDRKKSGGPRSKAMRCLKNQDIF